MSGAPSSERVAVWWNPRAGRASERGLARRALEAARARGHEADLLPTDRALATETVAEWIASGAIDRLIVLGGDGTLHHAIQAVAGTSVVVGVVPVGTGNDLVRAVGLDPATDAAIERALEPPAAIDLLRIDGRYGITVATLGFSVAVNRRAEAMRWPRGPAKYTVATLAELTDLRRYPLRLDLDGRRLDVAPNLLAVANTSIFGGGMQIAPGARPDDGRLEVVVIGPASRAAMLRLLPGVRAGRHVRHPAVEIHRGARLVIESEEPLEVWADGEIVASTPTEIELVPAALRLAGVTA